MRRRISVLFTVIMGLIVASPLFAQGTAAAAGASSGKLALSLGSLGLGIAAGLAGIGQGKATASTAEAIARNPGAAGPIRISFILGLVFIESLVLYTLVMTILKG